MSSSIYNLFLLLYVAIFFLSSKLCKSYSKYANDLSKLFVAQFSDFYGSDMLVYKIHNLIHISAYIERFGPLDSFSAFPFESFLGHLKKLVRKPTQALPQIIRRISEKILHKECNTLTCRLQDDESLKKHDFGPLLPGYEPFEQFNYVFYNNMQISLKKPNYCVQIGKQVCLIKNILYKEKKGVKLIYESFCMILHIFCIHFHL